MSGTYLCGLVLASCLAAVALGEVCAPDQWECMQGATGAYYSEGKTGITKEYIKMAYDATNQRKGYFVDYQDNEYHTVLHKVELYDADGNGRLYVVNLKTGSCSYKKLDTPFQKICIPEDAQLIGNSYMGLKGKGFPISIYNVVRGSITFTFSANYQGKNTFYPIGQTTYGTYGTTSFIRPLGHMDITPGAKNETMFEVPSDCKEMNNVAVTDYMMRDSFMNGF